jgi:hypothetical protein
MGMTIVSDSDRLDDVNRTGFRFRAGDLRSDWTNLQDMEIVKLFSWSSTRLPIKSIDDEARIVTFFGTSGTDPRLFDWARDRYFVDGVCEGLDQPGEWYLNRKSGVRTYWPFPNEDPSAVAAYAPVLEQVSRSACATAKPVT